MNTLLKAVEVWVPDADGQLLELRDGAYGSAKAFGNLSRAMCFGRGEGLPGRVWEEGRPILLKDLQAGYFRRATAARNAKLTCAVAMPVFAGDVLKAVVLFFCGEEGSDPRAIELWRNDPRVTTDMTLVDGYYGPEKAGGESMDSASRDTYLPRGAGLPGLAWQRQASVFMNDLSEAAGFVRAEEAAASGLKRGLAIPCPLPTRENYAVSFLSTTSRPFACRVESWTPDASGSTLRRDAGFSESDGKLPVVSMSLESAEGEGDDAIAEAFCTATPQLGKKATSAEAGATGMIALPIHGDSRVDEVVAIYF